MYRFLCSPQSISHQQIKIFDKNELHHLRDVLRLKNNDKVIILDGEGGEFICQINQLDRKCATFDVISRHFSKRQDCALKITVACALPKKSKVDFIVEKLTEIGVDRIVLLETERTEVAFKDPSKKIARFNKTAGSALKQSGNLFMPRIELLDFKGLLKLKKEGDYDLAIMPNLSADAQRFKEVLDKVLAKNVLVAIGPEGDFSEQEIELAKEAGFVSANLGKTVLKVDTAAIVAVGFVKLFYEVESKG